LLPWQTKRIFIIRPELLSFPQKTVSRSIPAASECGPSHGIREEIGEDNLIPDALKSSDSFILHLQRANWQSPSLSISCGPRFFSAPALRTFSFSAAP